MCSLILKKVQIEEKPNKIVIFLSPILPILGANSFYFRRLFLNVKRKWQFEEEEKN